MKFGNYNLTTATEKHNRLYIFRIKKVKNTANYIVGKFNNKINTIKTLRRIHNSKKKAKKCTVESPLSYRASLFDDRFNQAKIRARKNLFERISNVENIYEQCDSIRKYSSIAFRRGSLKSTSEHCVFDKVKFSKINNAISGKRQHRMLKNVYFTIKSNKCSNISSLYESMRFESLKLSSLRRHSYNMKMDEDLDDPQIKMDLSQLLKSTKYDEKTEYEILKNYFDSMSFTDIVKDKDFKSYLKQKNYQDAIDYIYSGLSLMGSSLRGDKSSIYGGIRKGQYYTSTATDVLRRYYDIDLDIVTESNDCDSIKQEKQQDTRRSQSVDRRKYYNRENSQFFCKSNKEFDDYYKKNTNIFYEANKQVDDDFFRKDITDLYKTCDRYFDRANNIYDVADDESVIDELYGNKSQPFIYSTMPSRKSVSKDFDDQTEKKTGKNCNQKEKFQEKQEDENSMFKKYQTYPLKKKPKKNYQQLLKYCEKSLGNYTTLDRKLEKLRRTNKKDFSEKNYHKIIKAFVKLRGFDTVENYVHYHYGKILDKSFDNNLKSKLKETMSCHDEQLVTLNSHSMVISKPILTTSTQNEALINQLNQHESLPPPYSSGSYSGIHDSSYFYKRHQNLNSKAQRDKYDDCFKNYEYIEHQRAATTSISTSVDADESHKRILFKFVEDLNENNIKIEFLMNGDQETKHAENCTKNIKSKINYEQIAIRNNISNTVTTTNNTVPNRCLHKHKSKFNKTIEPDDNIYESICVETNHQTNPVPPSRIHRINNNTRVHGSPQTIREKCVDSGLSVKIVTL